MVLLAVGVAPMRDVLLGAGDAGVAATAGVTNSHVRPHVPRQVLPHVSLPKKAGTAAIAPLVATRLLLLAEAAEVMRRVIVVKSAARYCLFLYHPCPGSELR